MWTSVPRVPALGLHRVDLFLCACADIKRLCQPPSYHTGPCLLEPLTRGAPLLFWFNLLSASMFLRWSEFGMPKGNWFQNATEGSELSWSGSLLRRVLPALRACLPWGMISHGQHMWNRWVLHWLVLLDTAFQGLGAFRLCFPQASYTHFI